MNAQDDSESIYRAPESDTNFTPEGDMAAAYVGPQNAIYYQRQFDRIRGGSSISWHWPAFFITAMWLLYRKMWLYALLYWIVLPLALAFTAGFIGATTQSPELIMLIYYGGYIVISFLLVPLFANRLYFGHVRSKVDRVAARTASPDQQAAELARIGGTSSVALIVAVFVIIAFFGILAAIAIPAYQDYTVRAQVSEGLQLAAGPRAAVEEHYGANGVYAADNTEAGLDPPEAISGLYVDNVVVYDGAIIVTYGNSAHSQIHGATLELLPVGYPDGRIEWECSSPDIKSQHLPGFCR